MSKRATLVVATSALLMTLATPSHAAVCSGVKFRVENSTSGLIQVIHVAVRGVGQPRTENLQNKKITSNNHWTSSNRRLGGTVSNSTKISVGENTRFSLGYKRWVGGGAKWSDIQYSAPVTKPCSSGTITFTIN